MSYLRKGMYIKKGQIRGQENGERRGGVRMGKWLKRGLPGEGMVVGRKGRVGVRLVGY